MLHPVLGSAGLLLLFRLLLSAGLIALALVAVRRR